MILGNFNEIICHQKYFNLPSDSNYVFYIFFYFSPTKPSSKLELLGNVKNQMSSWLGSGISGLRKSDSEVVPDPPAELLQETTKENIKEKEDDNSRWIIKFIIHNKKDKKFMFTFFSATGDPDTPISEGEDDLGNNQGGNGQYLFIQ